MFKMYKKSLLKRMAIYPAIVGGLTFYLLESISGTSFGNLFVESGPLAIMSDTLEISLPYETFKYYFAFAVGLSYGTMSAIFPVHKMKLGIIGFILIYLKYWLSLVVFAPLAMFLFPVELLMMGFFVAFKSMFGKPFKFKKKNQFAHEVV